MSFFNVFKKPKASPVLPTPEQVRKVTSSIADAIVTGPQSHKADLYFRYPQHWAPEKLGREGWLLHVPDLGSRVSFSVFAIDSDPAFDSSLDGLKRNAADLVKHQGGIIVDTRPCTLVGITGLEYRLLLDDGDQILSFLWVYRGGDYQFRVYATGEEHLRLIRPSINEFMKGFKMEPSGTY